MPASTRDYARRSPTRRNDSRKPKPRVRRQGRVLFHGGSFFGGLILGAVLVIITAYVPEWLGATPVGAERAAGKSDQSAAGAVASGGDEVRFEFHDLLENASVEADPEPYRVETPEETASEPKTYLVQAASYQDELDAQTLRAELILEDMPARTTKVRVKNTDYYRVVIGPFTTDVQAQRILTRLRQRGLSAFIFTQKAPA